MVTPAQLDANRANAQKSTGPRTPKGKAKVAGNAIKHGLGSRKLLVSDEQREQFAALHDSLRAQVTPEGALEEELFKELLHAAWNLERVRQLEDQLFTTCPDPLTDDNFDRKLHTYTRFHARFERSFHRALKELKALETNSAAMATYTEISRHQPPALVQIGQVFKQTQHFHRARRDSDPAGDWQGDPEALINDLASTYHAMQAQADSESA